MRVADGTPVRIDSLKVGGVAIQDMVAMQLTVVMVKCGWRLIRMEWFVFRVVDTR